MIILTLLTGISFAEDTDEVPPVDLSRLSPSMFADHELDLPYYLAHFHRVANAVIMEGENRGFIDLIVWRPPEFNHAYNARVMENILSLAFFYTLDRRWNPYRGSEAVRARLEAALDFWVRSQSELGAFSEYGHERWALASTGFGAMHMAETLKILRDGPPIDPDLHERVIEAQRKAIIFTLTEPSFYRHGKRFSNQFEAIWSPALMFNSMYPDSEIMRLVKERLAKSMDDLQSPAGFFYEVDGCDWAYNLNVHIPLLDAAWHHSRGTDLEPLFLKKADEFYAWLAYNAVIEPDGWGFVLNSGMDTRNVIRLFWGRDNRLAEVIPSARAFVRDKDRVRADSERTRRNLDANWPSVGELRVGTEGAYIPSNLIIDRRRTWHPDAEERTRAIQRLPYLAGARFNHQRADDRNPLAFTYVRRPGYYAAFNSGVQLRDQQRHGLGFVYHERAGTFLHSQSNSSELAWGTKTEGMANVYEAETLLASFEVSGTKIEPSPGAENLPHGDLKVEYSLGESGRKSLVFREDEIEVVIEHPGRFSEIIPILQKPDDQLSIEPGKIILTRGTFRFEIGLDSAATAESHPTDQSLGPYKYTSLRLPAEDGLKYRISLRDE